MSKANLLHYPSISSKEPLHWHAERFIRAPDTLFTLVTTFSAFETSRKRNLGHVRNGKKENKARRRAKEPNGEEMHICRIIQNGHTMLPRLAEITPGAVPSSGFRNSTGEHTLVWWLHATIWWSARHNQSWCTTERWWVGQEYCLTEHHEQPGEYLKQPERIGGTGLGEKRFTFLQVRGVDQSPYQSWHSPLRWATSYAHEAPPLLSFWSLRHRVWHTHTHTRHLPIGKTSLKLLAPGSAGDYWSKVVKQVCKSPLAFGSKWQVAGRRV